ncbi:MAG: FAD-dependent oxidoreductase [Chloroflexi bacterium]|nr:FAD-dependent oxidoreductase [Chloroflexota bacterium]
MTSQDGKYPALFSSGRIGTMELPNRVVMAPMVTRLATDTGAVSQRQIDYYEERALGGAGLVIVEASCVHPTGRAFVNHLRIDGDEVVTSHFELTEAVHRAGARIAIQLHHGGHRSTPQLVGGNLVAPSEVPEPGSTHVPKALTVEEIEELVEAFGQAAIRAVRAGYDAVEVHGAHGYLIHQFLSPGTNRRTDKFGGSPENRVRFATMVVQRVRQAVGPTYPIIFRLSAEGGYGLEEAVPYARWVAEAGVDALHISAGGTGPLISIPRHTSPMAYPDGWLVEHAATIRKNVSVPVIAVNQIREPAMAEAVVAQGKADFVALGRPLVADPFWPAKVRDGREAEVCPCISCDYCRTGLRINQPIRCLVNPTAGREAFFRSLGPAPLPRRVVVIGGGPGGMEAAWRAAKRGHKVSLYEREQELGGQLWQAVLAPDKERIWRLQEFLTGQLKRGGVQVHTGAEIDGASLESLRPDAVILASGAEPVPAEVPGASASQVALARDVLMGKVSPQGQDVVVLGGRQVGCETAEFLARRGHRVTVVARSPEQDLAKESPWTYREALLGRLRDLGVRFLTRHDVRRVQGRKVALDGSDGQTSTVEADLIVMARGSAPQGQMAEALRRWVREVHVVGDCVEPRTIAEAVYEGALAGSRV